MAGWPRDVVSREEPGRPAGRCCHRPPSSLITATHRCAQCRKPHRARRWNGAKASIESRSSPGCPARRFPAQFNPPCTFLFWSQAGARLSRLCTNSRNNDGCVGSQSLSASVSPRAAGSPVLNSQGGSLPGVSKADCSDSFLLQYACRALCSSNMPAAHLNLLCS